MKSFIFPADQEDLCKAAYDYAKCSWEYDSSVSNFYILIIYLYGIYMANFYLAIFFKNLGLKRCVIRHKVQYQKHFRFSQKYPPPPNNKQFFHRITHFIFLLPVVFLSLKTYDHKKFGIEISWKITLLFYNCTFTLWENNTGTVFRKKLEWSKQNLGIKSINKNLNILRHYFGTISASK